MGNKGSKAAPIVTETKGEEITTAKVLGRVWSLFMIMIWTMILLVIGAVVIQITGQSGQTGPMVCMVIFGLLLLYSVYTLNGIKGVVTIKTTTKRNWFGYPKKEEEDDSGDIYWAFEIALSGIAGSLMLVLLAFNKYNKPPSGGTPRAAARNATPVWKSVSKGRR